MTPKVAQEWSFEAIGTGWWIGVYESITDEDWHTLQQRITVRIEAFDKVYSRFRDDSLILKIAQKAGTYELPTDSKALFALYRTLYDLSEGLVTPLIGRALSDAGYDAKYSLQSHELQETPAWDAVMTYKNNQLITKQPLLLDFGAAGKGYLVDIVAELLTDAGISQFCVDAGGDMVCRGLAVPLRVGLENPDDFDEVVGVALLQNKALCGSAGNRRAWGKYHHIMDPEALKSPDHIKALWVITDSALLADGLATALFFTTPEKLQARFPFSYVIIYADGRVSHSNDFPGELFTEKHHV